ncbi:methyltransferase family protein [Mycolicibacterium lutetiense]
MAVTALILYLIFAVLGFGWRSRVQYRKTGSTGFRGINGRPGSLEWLAGVGFIVSIIVGVTAPVLQYLGFTAPMAFLHAPWVQSLGTVLAVTGIAATVYAQLDMGESWRIGVDPSETTTLVRNGVFGLVRNPIFSAMLVFAGGVMLMTPNPVALLAFVVLSATIELQVRVVEEPYLLRTHGQAYRDYCVAVGRFLPGVGRDGVSQR